MVPTLIIIALSLYWLLLESDYLRVRLSRGETLSEYDKRILDRIKQDYDAKEIQYSAWLASRYETKLVYGSAPGLDYPQYKWMTIEDDVQKRRSGEMLYQRGGRW